MRNDPKPTSDRRQLAADEVARFALAGDAILTLENARRSTHVTLWIQAKKNADEGAPLFVKVFTGSDNTNRHHYSYVGTIWQTRRDGSAQEPEFRHGSAKAKLDRDDVRVKTVEWFLGVVRGDRAIPDHVTVWHEGRCCYCHIKLTQPESVRRGYGPICAKTRGLPYGKQTRPAKPKPAPRSTGDLADGETRTTNRSGRRTYTMKNVRGVYSCSCPAWRFQKNPIGARTCKHLGALRGYVVESDRIAGVPTRPAPKLIPEPVPAATVVDDDGLAYEILDLED